MGVDRQSRDWRRWNVAVTGINARAESPGPGCAVARCLRECSEFSGTVVGLGYDVLDAGLYARDYCHGGYLIPYPSAGKDVLLERIIQIDDVEHIDVIIPCLDAEIQNFIAIKNELARMGIAMLLPNRMQFQMRAKDHLGAFCESVGVLAPESKTITNPAFFDSCEAEGWEYPLVIKGIFYDASIAYSAAEARLIFDRLVASWGYPILVQKLIKGDEYDLSAIGDGRGGLQGAVMMRKRGLTDKGKAWAGVTVVDDDILDAACKLVKGLNWSGPLEVEVMKDRDGKIYLIEINPRFPAWIYLSHAAGRNLPVALLRTLAGETDLDLPAAKAGTFFIRYAQELIVQLPEFESMMINGGISSAEELLTAS